MKKGKSTFIIIFCFTFLIIFIGISVFSAFKLNVSYTNAELKSRPVVIVDAGHGGIDGGAIAIDGTNEKNLNLDIAIKLEKLLTFYGYKVIMTRTTDIMTCDENLNSIRQKKVSDIHNRFKIIEDNPQALFVSIHQNKFADSSQWGTQVFYSKNNPSSKLLAESIQSTVTENLQPNNKRVVKCSGTEIFLLYHAKSTAVLVECGFVSNYSDLEKLKSDTYKKEMAILIADGIIKYNQTGD